MLEGHKLIHLVGIGGCSMNGLAQILRSRGFSVQGSDKARSQFTRRLEQLGIPVFIGHDAKNLGDADLLIYSAAIRPDNPERAAAREHNIPEVERADALGMISEGFEQVVAIAGCHGKTTITSMLALIACRCDSGEAGAHPMDATIHIGGFVDFLNGGVRIGRGGMFITEACEYVESFLALHPTIELISNIDDDHLDYYHDIEHITDAFGRFTALLPEGGVLIGCNDDARVRGLLDGHEKGRSITYGVSDADYMPSDISFDSMGNPSFDLICYGENIGRVSLSVPGEHNMMNAVAALSVALTLGVPFNTAACALNEYTLTRRRFELMGESGGVKVFHDYAHHPSEIRAVVGAAVRCPHKKLFCVLQCNSFTRAKTLFTGDMSCLRGAQTVIVPDIYPGRERDTGDVHARDIVNAIAKSSIDAIYIPTFEEIRDYLTKNAGPGDIVLTMGSGDVYEKKKKLI